ncbi:hypothetical protein [Streptomyces europaeiscabiei]|uniref:hypothetical protein n=1 Tax=Streptomyces europaeiscabiei TaxID=146819 RepID=UPI002E129BF8|nr:hypothetical protein OHB30_04095 [Streptomyces europaeiscabiei]
MDALHRLESAGCRSALVPTVGLDAPTTRAFIDFARTSEMAVHGPNCMGFINHTDGIPLWIDTANVTGAEPGNVALIAQSGSAAIFARCRFRTTHSLAHCLPSVCRARCGVVARMADIGRCPGRSGRRPGARIAAAQSTLGPLSAAGEMITVWLV